MSVKSNTNSDSLRPVVLLLATAVILPTVCLLWFMTQAVKNERLAVQQKLVDFYTKRAKYFFVEVPNQYFAGPAEHLNSYPITETHNFFGLFAVGKESFFQGMLIYDTGGNLLYPPVAFQMDAQTDESMQPFPNKAKETIELAYKLSYPDNQENISPVRAAAIMRYRVFTAECFLETKDERLYEHLRRILGNDYFCDKGPAETIVWQLEKLIAIADQAGLADRLASQIQSALYRIAAYRNAFEAAFCYSSVNSLSSWPNQTVRRLAPGLDLYGFKLSIANQTVVGISTPEKILKILNAAIQDMQDDTIGIQIIDNFGTVVAGNAEKTEKPFLTFKAGKNLPDFTVSVFFKDSSVFEKAAQRQTAIYTWTGVLVVSLMLLAGVVAIRAVQRQIRLNRLKNDFIATVTHELKTPLSSMRLLVETLLDGSYTDKVQCREYLELICRENHRLSRMIDSFLTFSRMERGKQVFETAKIAPAEIIQAAAEAVQAKFQEKKCRFSVTADKGLASIYADKDAMVTVLVNLLDNACKYSGDDKEISLRVFEKEACVCFSVADNGIGMTRRQIKRIFEKFYQADTSLSRRAEGCGLGLSIVKYILDAHNGRIDVESKPGKGSVFTVCVPMV